MMNDSLPDRPRPDRVDAAETASSGPAQEALSFPPHRDRFQNFFILGCPRSGTTLLQVLLNRHPRIVIPPEMKLFYYFHGMPNWMRRRAVERWQRDLGIRLPERVVYQRGATAEVFQQLCRGYAERCGKPDVSHLGEKTPEQTHRLCRIFDTFPQARVLLCIRDGRDVAHSLSRVPWLRADHLAGITIWKRYAGSCLPWLRGTEQRILPVPYERLVCHPGEQLALALRHLGLDDAAAPRLLSGQNHQDGLAFPARERGWKHHALQPPNGGSIGKYHRHFNAVEIAAMEYLAERELTEFGYALSNSPPCLGRPWRVKLAQLSSLARLAASLPAEAIVSELYHALATRHQKGDKWNRRPMYLPQESCSGFPAWRSCGFPAASSKPPASDRCRSD